MIAAVRRFNSAATWGRGEPTAGAVVLYVTIALQFGRDLGPRRTPMWGMSASDWGSGFNSAATWGRGEPKHSISKASAGGTASIRPRPGAAENLHRGRARRVPDPLGFNSAATWGRGEPASSRVEGVFSWMLQFGRDLGPRRTVGILPIKKEEGDEASIRPRPGAAENHRYRSFMVVSGQFRLQFGRDLGPRRTQAIDG
ncbi:MAG: hypothetical protein JWO38_8236 [Gemmataceae bacterium]|nr:hypothetical protein [Gemmataceae bacterium]